MNYFVHINFPWIVSFDSTHTRSGDMQIRQLDGDVNWSRGSAEQPEWRKEREMEPNWWSQTPTRCKWLFSLHLCTCEWVSRHAPFVLLRSMCLRVSVCMRDSLCTRRISIWAGQDISKTWRGPIQAWLFHIDLRSVPSGWKQGHVARTHLPQWALQSVVKFKSALSKNYTSAHKHLFYLSVSSFFAHQLITEKLDRKSRVWTNRRGKELDHNERRCSASWLTTWLTCSQNDHKESRWFQYQPRDWLLVAFRCELVHQRNGWHPWD